MKLAFATVFFLAATFTTSAISLQPSTDIPQAEAATGGIRAVNPR